MNRATNARNNGSRFEEQIGTILKVYASRGFMRCRKVEQPIKTFGPPGRQRVVHLENPFLDFVGAWTERSGRAIFFEAKSTSEPKLRLGTGGLSETQAASLHLWEVANAVTFLLWEYDGDVRLWTNRMIAAQSKEWRHLKFENGKIIPPGIGFVFWDFRSVMTTLWSSPACFTPETPMKSG